MKQVRYSEEACVGIVSIWPHNHQRHACLEFQTWIETPIAGIDVHVLSYCAFCGTKFRCWACKGPSVFSLEEAF